MQWAALALHVNSVHGNSPASWDGDLQVIWIMYQGKLRSSCLFLVKSWSIPVTGGFFSVCVHHHVHASAYVNTVRGRFPTSHILQTLSTFFFFILFWHRLSLARSSLNCLGWLTSKSSQGSTFLALRFQVCAITPGVLYMGSDDWPWVLNTCMVSIFSSWTTPRPFY